MVQMNLFSKQKYRHRHQEQIRQAGRGGGMDWETGIDVYTLLCMKQIPGEGLLYRTEKKRRYSLLTGHILS